MPLKIFFTATVFISLYSFAQPAIDTVKVYNVNGSYESPGEIFVWGGNWTPFFPSENCPEPKEKYYLNYQNVKRYMEAQIFFWIELYNTNDELIFEGLKYSDCTIGPFICYHPNGAIQISGQYGGYKIKNGQYKLKKCAAAAVGTWSYYDENGQLIKTEKHK